MVPEKLIAKLGADSDEEQESDEDSEDDCDFLQIMSGKDMQSMFEMGLLGLCAHEQVGASPWIGSEGSLPQL